MFVVVQGLLSPLLITQGYSGVALPAPGTYRVLSATYRVDADPQRLGRTYRRGASTRRASYRRPS